MNWFVGLGPIILKYVMAIGLGGSLLVVAFVPIAWIPMWVRKICLYAGGAIVACTVAYSVGVHDENKRDQARWVASNNQEIKSGEQARTDGNADVDRAGDSGMQHDRHNRDTRNK